MLNDAPQALVLLQAQYGLVFGANRGWMYLMGSDGTTT